MLVEEHGPDFILSGCLDEAMQARSRLVMTRGRDALTTLLEAAHAPD